MIGDLSHGGAIDHMRMTFPVAPEPWVDLSTGINPWPYPVDGVDLTVLHQLPLQTAFAACRSAMASAFDAPEDSVVPGPGSEILIRLLPTVVAPRHVAILSPAYSDHALVWKTAAERVSEIDSLPSILEEVDLLVLCNPGYVDGKVYAHERLEGLRSQLAARGGWMIVDEAYADLDPGASLARWGGRDGLIVLRSGGKFFGLPGVRIGALIAPAAIREAIAERLGVWCVSSLALHIARKAYADLGWQTKTRARLGRASRRLDAILTGAGFSGVCGTDLYRVVETPSASETWLRLAHQGIYVRRFTWSERHLRFGLPRDRAAENRLARAFMA